MNKYEKAIKYFEEHMKVLDNHCKHGGDFALEAREHTQTAIEALRKQVPRALSRLGDGKDEGYGECPNCYHGVDTFANFCECCGSAISGTLAVCISNRCMECPEDTTDRVCPYYAAKTDEIRRIHEEG